MRSKSSSPAANGCVSIFVREITSSAGCSQGVQHEKIASGVKRYVGNTALSCCR